MAAGAGANAGRQEADARAAVRRAAVRRRDRRHDDDRASRCLQRQGKTRPGVAAQACELAAGVRSGVTDRERLLDELRPVAFAIACRMLGSASEAENVVQEALLRVGARTCLVSGLTAPASGSTWSCPPHSAGDGG